MDELLRNMELAFYEELAEMPYIEKCIVIGVALRVDRKEMIRVLNISESAFNKLYKEKCLKRWKYFTITCD